MKFELNNNKKLNNMAALFFSSSAFCMSAAVSLYLLSEMLSLSNESYISIKLASASAAAISISCAAISFFNCKRKREYDPEEMQIEQPILELKMS